MKDNCNGHETKIRCVCCGRMSICFVYNGGGNNVRTCCGELYLYWYIKSDLAKPLILCHVEVKYNEGDISMLYSIMGMSTFPSKLRGVK